MKHISFSVVVCSLGLSLTVGCTNRSGSGSGSGSGTGGSGTSGADETADDGEVDGGGIALATNRDVDILFVVDNSASMGEEQAMLSRDIDAFLDVLDSPDRRANYRIGFTTTDDGNPWCQGTGPEGGNLRLTSCRSRLDEFAGGTDDFSQEACLDLCPDDWETIAIQPTSTDEDPQLVARPWIESTEGVANLPDGLTMPQAFQCLSPQGTNGCGFESPLESMWKALRRSETDTEPAYGFIRDHATLAIVHLTDEADCSYNDEWETIFLPEGNRVFWSDPNASAPTSALCWNAGVACVGSGVYDACESIDLDADGNEVANAEDDAVLHPVARYVDFVQDLESTKQLVTPDQQVLVSVIGGVDPGLGNVTVTYQDALDDPQFQNDFGIGPGCTSPNGAAIPPVRMREFAEAFSVELDRNMFSICDDDFSPALRAVAESIAAQARPACMPACVADTDPTTTTVEPQCALRQDSPLGDGSIDASLIPECTTDGSLPSDADNVCFIALVDDGTPQKTTDREIDDMSERCVEEGWNLEFKIVRRPGFPARSGTAVVPNCQLSANRMLDCPLLP